MGARLDICKHRGRSLAVSNFRRLEMYGNLDIEWDDAACDETFDVNPEIGDRVLCYSGDDPVLAGELVSVEINGPHQCDVTYTVSLDNGWIAEFKGEKVIKRKI